MMMDSTDAKSITGTVGLRRNAPSRTMTGGSRSRRLKWNMDSSVPSIWETSSGLLIEEAGRVKPTTP